MASRVSLRPFPALLFCLLLTLAWALPGCTPTSTTTTVRANPDPGRYSAPAPRAVPASAVVPVVTPLSRPGAGYVVVIDAGHGGNDPGAQYPGIDEKDLNLDVARLLRNELQRQGYSVEMTRATDVFIPLEDRTSFARRLRADIFVAIHANAARDGMVSGTEIYFPEGGGRRVESSRRLGDSINRRLQPEAIGPDRGVKPAYFTVLRTSSCPAVLVEVGFLSHRSSRVLLGTDSYRRDVAHGIALGIDDYFSTRKSR